MHSPGVLVSQRLRPVGHLLQPQVHRSVLTAEYLRSWSGLLVVESQCRLHLSTRWNWRSEFGMYPGAILQGGQSVSNGDVMQQRDLLGFLLKHPRLHWRSIVHQQPVSTHLQEQQQLPGLPVLLEQHLRARVEVSGRRRLQLRREVHQEQHWTGNYN